MIDRIDSEFRVQHTALNLRSYRQELLASNIANGDTPHYKARDFDFKSSLANALGGASRGALTMSRTAAGHQDSSVGGRDGVDVQYRNEYQGAVDGNTVNMDVERAAFTENAVQIEAMLTFMRSKFKDMQTAIQGQ
ncbi:flagellar basal body rod protein FlgB [Denitratisoma oestradiolicum]|uniref:Flagellar basal body rod protein FlgB n=1 Tax=Denitratisoma oestradiolicum TaxID=311182 RepID=A0A6S6YS56_9PROT|nr:flagellar basal body rod protein FlgB [Denitratisoma oestradiolicum]TWO81604.1 flagellar basal-body rod protein FlgB [Denitratisoma oestradiolicum]CAB1370542.1 Flagellar basal body rod protein FlgB [Denitratisoma oestradiolicum]